MTSDYKNDLINILDMLSSIETDLNLINYNETEKKIYYTIAKVISSNKSCNITDVILQSKFSRSTVYKTIKKFELANLIVVKQSTDDKREFNIALAS
tara:strand:- start:634 stop:924 length:291 start_codon:yes stop_codon:yes gene_type:complete